VVIYEGSVANERLNDENGGYWAGLGARLVDGEPQPFPTADMLALMSKHAAAIIAIGTCATWGGVPAAAGNVTGSMGLMDFLKEDYRSTFGLPVVNIPGCAPQGDNFTETVVAVLLFLQGVGPLPEFDHLGRPAWLFTDTVHQTCTRGGFYEEGIFAKNFGDKQCLVEIGCWGPVVQCNINKRGALNHVGGCMNVGAPCIGCTMPGFPDNFSPFYTEPPGTMVSSTTSKTTGFFIRNLRRFSMMYGNRSKRWIKDGHVPSGWGRVDDISTLQKVGHYFYEKIQFYGSIKPGSLESNKKHFLKATENTKIPPEYE
jgi:hydrogenase small subunit